LSKSELDCWISVEFLHALFPVSQNMRRSRIKDDNQQVTQQLSEPG